jgi:hypothetical protein
MEIEMQTAEEYLNWLIDDDDAGRDTILVKLFSLPKSERDRLRKAINEEQNEMPEGWE